MKKLKKLILPEGHWMGIYCPYHLGQMGTEHNKCIKGWEAEAIKNIKNTVEYKNMEIINSLVDKLNKQQ